MKLVAIHNIHANRRVTHMAPKDKDSAEMVEKVKHVPTPLKPGTEFETSEFGIDDDEARVLIARGSAKRKMREVVEDDEEPPVLAVTREPPALSNATGKAPNTAPRGPASGSTGAPAPNTEAAGRNAK